MLKRKKNYTREKLAEMAGISPKFLYEIEIGSKGFSADTLYKLAEALNTNTDFILYGEYRGKADGEAMRLLNQFEGDQKKTLINILELICEFKNKNH